MVDDLREGSALPSYKESSAGDYRKYLRAYVLVRAREEGILSQMDLSIISLALTELLIETDDHMSHEELLAWYKRLVSSFGTLMPGSFSKFLEIIQSKRERDRGKSGFSS